MADLLKKIGGFGGPPTTDDTFSNMDSQAGSDLFRLMSKANKYSESTSTQKQKKAGEYGYMAGQMMQEHGIDDPKYSQYMTAAQQGEQHGMNTEMLNDFRSGARTQQRKERREQNGRYDSRPDGGNAAQGKKAEDGSMFHFFDSDTSSSSGEE